MNFGVLAPTESGGSQVPPRNEQTEEQPDLPRLEEVFSTYVPTIIYVPKAARNDWSRLLSDELALIFLLCNNG